MITPVYDCPEAVKTFVAAGIFPPGRLFGEATAIGFLDKKQLTTGIVYHNYDPDTEVIEISAFAIHRNWCNKEILKIIFQYPFDQLKVRIVLARCSEHNKLVRRIWKALGASEYLIPELRGPNEAEAVLILRAQDWAKSKFMRK